MKPKKLKSGNWNIRVELPPANGKRRWKSITAKTEKECRRLAALYEVPDESEELLLADACQMYLETRGPELSPATVHGYMGTYRTYIQNNPIGSVKLGNLKSPAVQRWISSIPAKKKTKLNHLGFLRAVVNYYCENVRFRVRIQDEIREELYVPSVEDIRRVLEHCDPDTAKAILLGTYGLRRGEICALTAEDLKRGDRCLVRVNKDIVKSDSKEWVVKVPKTRKSIRWVEINPEVMNMLPKEGPVISCSPDCISNRFARAVRRAGVPHFRFHDLRAFFASTSITTLGLAEKSVQNIGGWQTSSVLRKHYDRTVSAQQEADQQKILAYFRQVLTG